MLDWGAALKKADVRWDCRDRVPHREFRIYIWWWLWSIGFKKRERKKERKCTCISQKHISWNLVSISCIRAWPIHWQFIRDLFLSIFGWKKCLNWTAKKMFKAIYKYFFKSRDPNGICLSDSVAFSDPGGGTEDTAALQAVRKEGIMVHYWFHMLSVDLNGGDLSGPSETFYSHSLHHERLRRVGCSVAFQDRDWLLAGLHYAYEQHYDDVLCNRGKFVC